jgi:hypothetical protein
MLACAIAGCGDAPKELPVAKSAHGGRLVTLPDDQGYAEIVVEVPAATKSVGKVAIKSRMVVYFFKSDATTELSPAPTDVKITIGDADSGRVVNLSPDPKAAGKFASEPGDHPDGFRGSLEANIGGKPIQAEFLIR